MSIDVEKFASHLRTNAKNQSQGRCARFVRLALEAAGANTSDHPLRAKDWGPILTRNGFHVVPVPAPEYFKFKKGDIVVIQPYSGGNPAGHIAGFDGEKWISDFAQRDFWAGPTYRRERPEYAVYRP